MARDVVEILRLYAEHSVKGMTQKKFVEEILEGGISERTLRNYLTENREIFNEMVSEIRAGNENAEILDTNLQLSKSLSKRVIEPNASPQLIDLWVKLTDSNMNTLLNEASVKRDPIEQVYHAVKEYAGSEAIVPIEFRELLKYIADNPEGDKAITCLALMGVGAFIFAMYKGIKVENMDAFDFTFAINQVYQGRYPREPLPELTPEEQELQEEFWELAMRTYEATGQLLDFETWKALNGY